MRHIHLMLLCILEHVCLLHPAWAMLCLFHFTVPNHFIHFELYQEISFIIPVLTPAMLVIYYTHARQTSRQSDRRAGREAGRQPDSFCFYVDSIKTEVK